jgi:hypothetical protein
MVADQRRERRRPLVVSALRQPGLELHGRDRALGLDAELQPVTADARARSAAA